MTLQKVQSPRFLFFLSVLLVFNNAVQLLRVYSFTDRWMNKWVWTLVVTTEEIPSTPRKICSSATSFTSNLMDWPGLEPRLSRWEASDCPPEWWRCQTLCWTLLLFLPQGVSNEIFMLNLTKIGYIVPYNNCRCQWPNHVTIRQADRQMLVSNKLRISSSDHKKHGVYALDPQHVSFPLFVIYLNTYIRRNAIKVV